MWDTKTALDLANDYRFALDVMEENWHLGLDDEAASKIRGILLRRIDRAKAASGCSPVSPVRVPNEPEKVFA